MRDDSEIDGRARRRADAIAARRGRAAEAAREVMSDPFLDRQSLAEIIGLLIDYSEKWDAIAAAEPLYRLPADMLADAPTFAQAVQDAQDAAADEAEADLAAHLASQGTTYKVGPDPEPEPFPEQFRAMVRYELDAGAQDGYAAAEVVAMLQGATLRIIQEERNRTGHLA